MSSSGRIFTDYNQNSLKNEKIKNEYGIKNNESYRAFLVKHAETIMHRNYNEMTLLNQTTLFRPEKNNKPYLFLGVHDDRKPKGYSESDLKDTYLTREKLNAMRKRQFIN
jgi:hypothetical protein